MLKVVPLIMPYLFKILLQVAFLQDGACAADEQCGTDVADNYPKLFKNTTDVLSVTQEFGTYSGIWVTLQLIKENHKWHYDVNNVHVYNVHVSIIPGQV